MLDDDKLEKQFYEGYKLGIQHYETMLKEQINLVITSMNKLLTDIEQKINKEV